MKIWRTLRFRIALWSALVSVLVVLAFGVGVTAILYFEVVDDVDDSLKELGKNLLEELDDEDHVDRDDLLDLFDALDEDVGFHVVSVTDSDGKTRYRASFWEKEKFTFSGSSEEDYIFTQNNDEYWRLARIERRDWIVVIAANLDEFYDAFIDLLKACAMALPVAFILVAFGGWWVARKALEPVSEITRTAERISARNLRERISATDSDDELGRLSQVFNAMVGRLEASFEQTARFSADASHELNTPLTIMQGELELALQKENLGSDEEALLANLLEEVQRLKAITRSLLLFSRSDAGILPLRKSSFDLSEEIASLIQDVKLMSQAEGLTFVEEIPESVTISGDDALLKQAIHNLLSNAVKYNRPGGTIKVSLKTVGGDAVCGISNAGPGIAPRNQGKVFQRFFREESSRSRQMDGFGLGLSLAREIVRAHGGDIWLEKSDLEETVFRLRLPRAGSAPA